MENEYVIRYSFGIIWKKYSIIFNDKFITLFDDKKINSIGIYYQDISHIFRQPLSFDQIDIYCLDDILKNRPSENTLWFPPRPTYNSKVFWFSIHSLKRGQIIKSFANHGVKTTLDPMEWKSYWDNIHKKWSE